MDVPTTNSGARLVVLGTSSGVGKTLITMAICRWLRDQGVSVTPFKSLSMEEGPAGYPVPPDGVIHFHQAYQAIAAGVAPERDMNPIAIWTTPDGVATSVRGQRTSDWLFQEPATLRTSRSRAEVLDAYRGLERRHDAVIAEGCGSPVEMNLKERDVTNLWLAEATDASCILVCTTVLTGVFAALLGTLDLMTPGERRRVVGFVVNRFDGDHGDFDSAVEILETCAGIPCLGVIPHFPDGPLAGPVPTGPEMARRMAHSAELEERISAWTAHVAGHMDFAKMMDAVNAGGTRVSLEH
ncbi:hypothetical protein E1264_04190 [Actinomadura sp. KC216]|uniref:AAA family ATPase n=1 Tax=Actinomadura sp. KC216 TaxID=2530370 RepID=UPI0010516030|nr:AAA family ATPase [Actinomadura sp. KC216]TDB90681.1 hypothetical protein E1264_04190 [Actinomadura sp. KC216]